MRFSRRSKDTFFNDLLEKMKTADLGNVHYGARERMLESESIAKDYKAGSVEEAEKVLKAAGIDFVGSEETVEGGCIFYDKENRIVGEYDPANANIKAYLELAKTLEAPEFKECTKHLFGRKVNEKVLGPIWVVIDPTEDSEMVDILWKVENIEKLLRIFVGTTRSDSGSIEWSRYADENWVVYDNEEEAAADAKARMEKRSNNKTEEMAERLRKAGYTIEKAEAKKTVETKKAVKEDLESDTVDELLVIARGVSDEEVANNIAQERGGQVIKDEEDQEKFMVVKMKESKEDRPVAKRLEKEGKGYVKAILNLVNGDENFDEVAKKFNKSVKKVKSDANALDAELLINDSVNEAYWDSWSGMFNLDDPEVQSGEEMSPTIDYLKKNGITWTKVAGMGPTDFRFVGSKEALRKFILDWEGSQPEEADEIRECVNEAKTKFMGKKVSFELDDQYEDMGLDYENITGTVVGYDGGEYTVEILTPDFAKGEKILVPWFVLDLDEGVNEDCVFKPGETYEFKDDGEKIHVDRVEGKTIFLTTSSGEEESMQYEELDHLLHAGKIKMVAEAKKANEDIDDEGSDDTIDSMDDPYEVIDSLTEMGVYEGSSSFDPKADAVEMARWVGKEIGGGRYLYEFDVDGSDSYVLFSVNKELSDEDARRLNLVDFMVEDMRESKEEVEVKNPGILNVPKGKTFSSLPLKHYIDLAKKEGKSAISRAINNLARWNKKKNPEISKKATDLMTKLKKNKEWEKAEAKESISEDQRKKIDEFAKKLLKVHELREKETLTKEEQKFVKETMEIKLDEATREQVFEKFMDLVEEKE